jgi:WD40 repeat protein
VSSILDVQKEEVILNLQGHDTSVKTLAKLESKGLVASGGRDGKILLFDIREGDKAVGSL